MNGGNNNQELPVNPETQVVAETPRDPAPKKSSKKVIVIVSVIAAILIVALIVAIIVLNINRSGDASQAEDQAETTETATTTPEAEDEDQEELEKNSEILNEIRSEVNNMDLARAIEYLDEKLEEYSGTAIELNIKLIKAYAYAGEGESVIAMELLDEIDTSNFTTRNYMDYYEAMAAIANSLSDYEAAQEYADKYQEYYRLLFGNGFLDGDEDATESDASNNNEDSANGEEND